MSHKIKVAFFADVLIRDFDGAIKTVYQLIDRLPTDRFEYLFFSGMPPKHDFPFKVVKVPSLIIPFNITYKISLPRLARTKIFKELHQFKPDVIHVTTPSLLGFFAKRYAVKNDIPILSIYHTHFISYMQYYFKGVPFMIRFAENLTVKVYQNFYNRCELVYVPTDFMIDKLVEYGVERKRLKQWHRGLDTELFNPDRKDKDYIRSLTKNNKPCLLYASRIVYEKNVELLFEIYDEVEAEGIDVNFIVAGNGVAEQEARERMPDAIFMGYIDHNELGKLYASTDIFIFPSISETYGNVVMEAMVCGCIPVIARGGGSQALVEDGVNGFLCDPNNPSHFIEKIKLLLNDASIRKKMKKAGTKYLPLLNWNNLASIYYSDIEKLGCRKKADTVPKSVSE